MRLCKSLKTGNEKLRKEILQHLRPFSSVIENNLDMNLSSEILQHLVNLWKEFFTYFPEIFDVDLELVRKPFAIPIEKFTDDLQDELIDFRNESACKDMFETLSICKFWARVCVPYPRVGKKCIKVLLPFCIMYLCEAGFSTLVQIKTKARNRLDVEDDIAYVVHSLQLFQKLMYWSVQQQVSH